MIIAKITSMGSQISNVTDGSQDGYIASHGSVNSDVKIMAASTTSSAVTTWIRKPFHSIAHTSFGYLKYSTNRRLGRTSYSAIKPGVEASIKSKKVMEPTIQKAVKPCHTSHAPGSTEIGARSAGIKQICASWILSTLAP